MNVIEVMRRWPDQETAISHLERVRWNGTPVCTYCGNERVGVHASKDKKLPRWQCHSCHRAFSVTVGTIFHHSHLPLQKWFLALTIMLNAKKNVSNAQLGRDLDLPYKTAWSLALRIRKAMATDPDQRSLFRGIVEIDETYVGGKPGKSNSGGGGSGKPQKGKRGRGTDKMSVASVVEDGGRAMASTFPWASLTIKGLSNFYRQVVDDPAAIVMTGQYPECNGLAAYSSRGVINHSVAYPVGEIHTNTVEGFLSLTKRAWNGRLHHYSKAHADLYISKTAHQYNRRNHDPFDGLVCHMVWAA